MNFFEYLVTNETLKKVYSFTALVFFLFLLRDMANLLLLTFVFTYGLFSTQDFIYKRLSKVIKFDQRMVSLLVFIFLVFFVTLFSIKYIPVISIQLVDIFKSLSTIDFTKLFNKIDPKLVELIKGIDYKSHIDSISSNMIEYLTGIGKMGVTIFLSLIFSLFLVLEKNEMTNFGQKFEESKIKYFYLFCKNISKHFIDSFGTVLKLQFIISIINAALSGIILALLGFPQILGLTFMMFVFGLIPVAGVIFATVPLVIIAFQIGGITKIVYIIAMTVVLHSMEAYILKPKMMANETEMPIFITLFILTISEHLLGIWGLLVGIPLFMFFMNMVGVKFEKDKSETKTKPH